jgi:hypothetical protein
VWTVGCTYIREIEEEFHEREIVDVSVEQVRMTIPVVLGRRDRECPPHVDTDELWDRAEVRRGDEVDERIGGERSDLGTILLGVEVLRDEDRLVEREFRSIALLELEAEPLVAIGKDPCFVGIAMDSVE